MRASTVAQHMGRHSVGHRNSPISSWPAYGSLWHQYARRAASLIPRWPGRGCTSVSAADLHFGQPVHETHPHILKAGEITPGITAQEYHERRAKFALGLPEHGAAVLSAAPVLFRSGAVFFPYRQESNFMYLTGFLEPESIALIRKTGSNLGDYDFHLLCRSKDAQAEQWSGPWSGLDAARDVFNADFAADVSKVASLLPSLMRGVRHVYVNSERTFSNWLDLPAALSAAQIHPAAVRNVQPLVEQLRALKSPAEIANMRRAGQASGRAITAAMRLTWTRERDLHAFLDAEFIAQGCDGPAYVPVVAGGSRGRMIHYVQNLQTLRAGETVLVDAGGEYGGYIADITRTWPVSGKFSPSQRDLYDAVLRVQRTGVSLCRESAGLSLDRIHRVVEEGLRDQLALLGFDVAGKLLDVLFPHHVGHYVGLDVHDIPGYGRSSPLKAGQCVTIEPGIYVPDDDRFPRHFRGLAVRIEDSICVDDDSPLVLTTEAVKEAIDIESLRA